MPADSPIKEFISNSPEETIALGKQIAHAVAAAHFFDVNKCFTGCVIALQGTLGSGKTYLTKGIAAGFGITENLTSPTYTIINEYAIPITSNNKQELKFFHIDVYRLDGEKDFEDIGGIDILNSKGVIVIEWSERISNSLPSDIIRISIYTSGTSRSIRITGLDNI
ncbi:MAG: tRNA (adenosine(37)-N6)-threonylcarbamoyltransferase complex ATPase subunit type 1 TsaE [Treponema sp.]|nr:tRNA (adenosine(37)-N6)-threonylcarbamoyltransferase complex ATPase subunit type 1 TsaE [Treponema sp.]